MRLSCRSLLIQHIKSSIRRILGRQQSTLGYSIVKPGNVSPSRLVPDHIVKPSYVLTGQVQERPGKIEIKTEAQIEAMWISCKLARKVLNKVGKSIKVGMTTDDIDKIVHEECISHHAYPSPLLYKGFPKSVCTSVNNVAIHGIPDDRQLENGDIVNVDVTVYYGGYHGDTNETFKVGEVDKEGHRLLEVGRECLRQGISVCKPDARFCDIGMAVSEHAYSQGFSVIPQVTGHGIGSYFHGPPDIYHVEHITSQTLQVMKPGMTFTIEPVITEGGEDYEMLPDGWTVVSTDNSRSCQFEHTVLITNTGVEIMTKFYTEYEEI